MMRYFTKDWFLKCQIYPQTKALKDELDDTVKRFQKEYAQENLPHHLRENFMFHDGDLLTIETGADCIMELDCPFSRYHKIRFCSAVIKQALPPVGATWLYEELYHHKSGTGYEAHILFCKMMKPIHRKILATDLFETAIICRDILLE